MRFPEAKRIRRRLSRLRKPDITLLQHTSWRAFTIDAKRPYGNLNNYPVEMAQTLGLPVTVDHQGYARIAPELDQELTALHRKSQFVISPRCRPVGQKAIERYKAEMVVLAERAKNETAVELVVPLINTSAALFASP